MPQPEPYHDASRIERERAFHDHRFGEAQPRSSMISRFTRGLTQPALDLVYRTAQPRCAGARVLDYGCAEGQAAVILRRYGAASVTGIDISPVAVGHAAQYAATQGVSDVTFEVMNAEQLEFASGQFDFVFGIGILHHLDLSRSLGEIARVLTDGGSAVFLEPLAHNPFINAVRHFTPNARTADEHPLLMRDLSVAHRYFHTVGTQFVNLATLMGAPINGLPGYNAVHRALLTLDKGLLQLPWISRFAWNVVITLESPKTRT